MSKERGKWDRCVEEAEKRWACGDLTRHEGPEPTHCALGIIGHVNFGEKFEKRGKRGGWQDGYDQLATDSRARRMVRRLANVLREQNPDAARWFTSDNSDWHPPEQVGIRNDMDFVISINDNDGKEKIVAALKEIRKQEREKARKALRTKLKNKALRTVKPVKVEHVPATQEEVVRPLVAVK